MRSRSVSSSDSASRTTIVRPGWDRPCLAIAAPPLAVHGHDALDRRVTRAYEMFLADGEFVFAAAGPAVELPAGTVGVAWTMNRRDDGTPQGGGFDLLALDGDGRVVTDHQFIEGSR
ncbi:hypothetical protein ACFWM1_33940 [Nocardia sp. NPDC058379]|uniref:hypothetical protein n=1 Tax=unclassified Nocardia TaxID=2637762 RepID=UPI0036656DC0